MKSPIAGDGQKEALSLQKYVTKLSQVYRHYCKTIWWTPTRVSKFVQLTLGVAKVAQTNQGPKGILWSGVWTEGRCADRKVRGARGRSSLDNAGKRIQWLHQ